MQKPINNRNTARERHHTGGVLFCLIGSICLFSQLFSYHLNQFCTSKRVITINMRKRITCGAFSIMDTKLGYKTLISCRLHVELLLRNPAMFFLLCERSIEYLMLGLISCNNIHLILQNTNSNLTFSFIDVSYIYAHTHLHNQI